MRSVLITPPTVEPVTLADAKTHLRLQGTLDDDLVTALIPAARRYCEAVSHLRFVTQSWDIYLDAWDGRSISSGRSGYLGWASTAGMTVYNNAFASEIIRLPFGPVQTVDSVHYTDQGGADQVWDPSNYLVSAGNPARISPRQGVCYPVTAAQADCVRVRVTAGFGDTAADVPGPVTAAVKLVIQRLYSYRGSVSPEALNEVPITVLDLLNSVGCGANLFA